MAFEFKKTLEEEWRLVPKLALWAWLGFYGLFLSYTFARRHDFLITDYIFLPIHEGGHLLFGWFGHTLGILGGTLFQLGAPLAVAVYFIFQRHLTGTAFAAFFFFNNFLNVATYMADSRRQALQYVTVGDAEFAEHDWATIFSQFGVLEHDTQIAAVVRLIGWLGMIGVVAWLCWKARDASQAGNKSAE